MLGFGGRYRTQGMLPKSSGEQLKNKAKATHSLRQNQRSCRVHHGLVLEKPRRIEFLNPHRWEIQFGYLNPGICFITLWAMFPKANIVERVIPSCWAVGGSRLRGLGTEPGLGNTAQRRRGLSGEWWGPAGQLSHQCYKVEQRRKARACANTNPPEMKFRGSTVR